MFCSKSETGVEESETSKESETSETNDNVLTEEEPMVNTRTKKSNSKVKFIYFGLGVIVFIMFFVAASKISEGSLNIMQIESVGGQTLDEAYYAELGVVYSGYAMAVRAVGINLASLLVWLGLKE